LCQSAHVRRDPLHVLVVRVLRISVVLDGLDHEEERPDHRQGGGAVGEHAVQALVYIQGRDIGRRRGRGAYEGRHESWRGGGLEGWRLGTRKFLPGRSWVGSGPGVDAEFCFARWLRWDKGSFVCGAVVLGRDVASCAISRAICVPCSKECTRMQHIFVNNGTCLDSVR